MPSLSAEKIRSASASLVTPSDRHALRIGCAFGMSAIAAVVSQLRLLQNGHDRSWPGTNLSGQHESRARYTPSGPRACPACAFDWLDVPVTRE